MIFIPFTSPSPLLQWQIDYDKTLAKRASLWSSAAYGDPSDVNSWNFVDTCAALNPTYVQSFSNSFTKSFGYTAVDTKFKQVILAFSGSKDLPNFITDLKSGLRYDYTCELPNLGDGQSVVTYSYVHHGFCDYYKTLVEAGLMAEVMKLADDNPEFSVLVTGHSLGGAVAVLAAVDLVKRFKFDTNRIQLYTFGCPRVGDGNFLGETKTYYYPPAAALLL